MDTSSLINKIFGRLIVIEFYGKNKQNKSLWLCKCNCGTIVVISRNNLISRASRSCGCLRKDTIFKHGKSYTKIHKIWREMLNRCFNKNCKDYPNYGERGIKVCDEWLEFINFYKDMGDKPDRLSLDRINNNLGYYKENCKWSTQKEQCRNKRTNRFITYKGETKTLIEWAEKYNLTFNTIYGRVYIYKWSLEKAFNTPNLLTNCFVNKIISFNNKTQNLTQWSKELKIGISCLKYRLEIAKWTIEKAFTTPSIRKDNNFGQENE